MQFCSEPNCSVLVQRGRCPVHAPRSRDPHYAEVHRWFGTVAWLRLRAQVLRAEPFCRHCRQQGVNTVATDIDHIVRHAGDRVRFWDVTNLQPMCKACHSAKTARGQ